MFDLLTLIPSTLRPQTVHSVGKCSMVRLRKLVPQPQCRSNVSSRSTRNGIYGSNSVAIRQALSCVSDMYSSFFSG